MSRRLEALLVMADGPRVRTAEDTDNPEDAKPVKAQAVPPANSVRRDNRPQPPASWRCLSLLARTALSGNTLLMTPSANAAFLEEIRPKLVSFCRKHRLRHLAVFGSCSRGQQGLHSDIDLLATLEDPATVPADELFEMAGEAEELLGRPVDFVLRDRLEASSNRLAREHILATAVTIYGD